VDRRLPALGGPEMSEYQYYEFLAVDRPLTAAEQAEVRQLSSRARITAASFTNEYHWGDFKGSPAEMMQRYYDAHLYLANWGTHRVMLRLPRTLLSPETAGQYAVDGHVDVMTTPESVILDLFSQDESGEWEEGAEDSLSAIAGVRAELAAGDLRALYLAWLSAYGEPEWDEDEDEDEPPVPAGLGSLTAAQRALADFLRLDPDLLAAAAQASPELPMVKEDPGALAAHIPGLPGGEKDRLLMLVARDQAARVKIELLRGLRGDPGEGRVARPERTVAELLTAAAEFSLERHQHAAAEAAARQALWEGQRDAARQGRLNELAEDSEAAWAKARRLIGTKVPARYDEAVTLLVDLQELARRDGPSGEFERRFAALRREHLRKLTLIDRFDRAGLTS
jgi:hypothetical protein